ncbi:MAG: hypothetical protein RBS19_06135 [Bacteroidales bacterium]|nr:hypothetical protein [Bacteroidales bacterium]
MKTLKSLSMILLIGIIAVSCTKEGPIGPTGTNGTNGIDGNANVQVFGYSKDTLNNANFHTIMYSPPGLTPGLIDSSAIFVYYSDSHYEWNMANGFGPNGNYVTIQYTYSAPTDPYIAVYLTDTDGNLYSGADVIWDSARVFIIPANLLRSAEIENVDFEDYQAVTNFFNK